MADVFASGFETGDDSEWSGSNGSPTIVSSVAHDGLYCCYGNANGDEVYQDFSAATEMHARGYIRIDTLPSTNEVDTIGGLQFWGDSGTDIIMQMKLHKTGHTLKIGLTRYYPSTYGYYYTYDYPVSTWLCWEIYFKKHATLGEYRFWLNGVNIISATGLNTSSAPDVDQFRMGACAVSGISKPKLYCDCGVVSTTYIGTHEEFSDGFETGDFSSWDATEGNPTVQTSHLHCGSYAAKNEVFQYGVMGPYKNLGHHKEIFLQMEVKFDSTALTSGDYVEFLQVGRASDTLLKLRIKNDSGTIKWGFVYRHAGSDTEAYSGTATDPDSLTWYCVDIHIKCSHIDGETVGIYDMWVDGTNLADIKQTSKDTDYTGVTYLRARLTTDDPEGSLVYYDCITYGSTDPGDCHAQGSEETITIEAEPTACVPVGFGDIQVFRNCEQIDVIDVSVNDEEKGTANMIVPYGTPFIQDDIVHVIKSGFWCINGKVTEIVDDAEAGKRALIVQTKTAQLFDKIIDVASHQSYSGEDAGAIFADLIDYYFNGLFDSNNVNVNTGVTMTDVDFGEKTVGAAGEELADRAAAVFRVDKDNHVHLFLEGDEHCGLTVTEEDVISWKPRKIGGIIRKIKVKGDNVSGEAGSGIPERMFSDRRITTEEEAQQVAEALLERYGDTGKTVADGTLKGFWAMRHGQSVHVDLPLRGYNNESVVVKQITWNLADDTTSVTVGDAERSDLEFALRKIAKKTIEQQVNKISPHQGAEVASADPFLRQTIILSRSLAAEVRVQTAFVDLDSGTCSSPSDPATVSHIKLYCGLGGSGGSGSFNVWIIDGAGYIYGTWQCVWSAGWSYLYVDVLVPYDLSGKTLTVKAAGNAGCDVYVQAQLQVASILQHSHSVSQSEDHTFD